MAQNRYLPHLVVLPEDDANRQVMNGFIDFFDVNFRVINIRPVAKGWGKTLDGDRLDSLLCELARYETMRLLLVLDFDRQFNSRFEMFKQKVGDVLLNRAFLLGVLTNPEELKARCNRSFEKIGKDIAKGCRDDDTSLWEDELLRHNIPEIRRMAADVKCFLFRSRAAESEPL